MRKRQSVIKLEYEIEVTDEEGKVLEKRKGRSQSFLKNFTMMLQAIFRCVEMAVITDVVMFDTGGSSRTCFPSSTANFGKHHGGGAPSANDVYGLWVGKGITEVTPTDYTLADKIAHGTGTGQLNYGAMSIEAVETVGLVTRFRAVRVFSNGTGASIEVKEIGYVFHCAEVGGTSRYFLMMRDVFASPVVVPAGKSLTVRYICSVTA